MPARLAHPAALLLASLLAGCATTYEDGYDGGSGYYGGGYGYGHAAPYGYYGSYYIRRDDHYVWPYAYYFPHDRDRHHGHHDRHDGKWQDRHRQSGPLPAAETGPEITEPAPGGTRRGSRLGSRPGHPFEAGAQFQPPRRERGAETRDRRPRAKVRAEREERQDASAARAADQEPPPAAGCVETRSRLRLSGASFFALLQAVAVRRLIARRML